MKITVEKHALEAVLARAVAIVERKSTVAIITHALITARKGSIEIRTTDLDIEAVETMVAAVEKQGSCALPAATLYEIARNAKPGAEIHITSQDDDPRMLVQTGRSRFKLPVLPAGDFPIFEPQPMDAEITINADALGRIIARTSFAMSVDQMRYQLNGIYLCAADTGLRAVATNGHMLAKRDEPCDGKPGAGVIVPAKTVADIGRRVAGMEGAVTLATSASRITIKAASWVLTSKVIDGSFPDYERAIPTDNPGALTIDADEFAAAVKSVAFVAPDKTRIVRLAITDDMIEISARGDAEGATQVGAEYEGAALKFGLNSLYLMAALDALACDVLALDLPGAPAEPIIARSSVDGAGLVVLMPTRV